MLAGPGERRIELPETLTAWEVSASYLYTGVDHILEGLDHLLFVSGLLMVILLGVLAGTQRPTIKTVTRRLLLAVTGFTLGHSLTLALVTLGGFSAPSRLVETLIAFSIMIMALEIAKTERSGWAFRYPAFVAIAFGLLHGLGFCRCAAGNRLTLPARDSCAGIFQSGRRAGAAHICCGNVLSAWWCVLAGGYVSSGSEVFMAGH